MPRAICWLSYWISRTRWQMAFAFVFNSPERVVIPNFSSLFALVSRFPLGSNSQLVCALHEFFFFIITITKKPSDRVADESELWLLAKKNRVKFNFRKLIEKYLFLGQSRQKFNFVFVLWREICPWDEKLNVTISRDQTVKLGHMDSISRRILLQRNLRLFSEKEKVFFCAESKVEEVTLQDEKRKQKWDF